MIVDSKDTMIVKIKNVGIYKKYNEYELRFLQILVDKKIYGKLKNIQEVQGMKKKKVFLDHSGLTYEHIDMSL